MLISCTTCPVRGHRCDDCVVPAFLGLPDVASMRDVAGAPVVGAPYRDAAFEHNAAFERDAAEIAWENEDHRVLDLLCNAGLVTPQDAVEARVERLPFGLTQTG